MNYHIVIPILLFLNAFLHIVQGFLYGFNKKTYPVIIWGIVLAVLGFLWFSPVANWVKWATLMMPIIGGLTLSSQLKESTNAKWIDFGILILDVITAGLMVYMMFLNT